MKAIRGLALTLLAAAPLTLAACSSGSDHGASGKSSANTTDQMLAYVRCLRDNGVQVPDPDPNAPYNLNLPKNMPQSQMSQAMQACRRLAPAKLNNGQNPQAMDRQLALARCLRSKGLTVPDPQPGQGLQIQGHDRTRTQQALSECRRTTAQSPSTPSGRPS